MSSPAPGAAPNATASSYFDPRIWLLALGTFAVGTDNLVIAGILPDVAGDLHVGLDSAGLLVTAYALAYGIGSPLMAAITGKMKRERVVVWAIGAFAAANILCAAAPNYPLLIAARILAGIAAAVFTPSSYALAVSLSSPDRRGRALSTVLLGISISTVLGVPLGTAIGHRLNWHATFILVGVLSAIAMAALMIARVKSSSNTGYSTPASIAARLAPLARREILLALAPNLTWGIGSMIVFTYITPLLSPHFDGDTIVMLLLINGLGALVGSFVGGRLGDRFGPVRPMIFGFGLNTLNLILWGFVNGDMPITAIIVFIFAYGGWSTGPSQQMRIIRIDPASATVTLAINNAMYYLGSSIGAAIGGGLLGFMPPIDLTFIGSGVTLMALGMLFISVRYEQRRRATPPSSSPTTP